MTGSDESETDLESASDDDDQRICPSGGEVVLSAEQILFPESDSEEKHWIVNDSENSSNTPGSYDYVQEAYCTPDILVYVILSTCMLYCNQFSTTFMYAS